MSRIPEPVLREAVGRLAERIDGVFRSLHELRAVAAPLLNAPEVRHDALAGLQPTAQAIIDRHEGLVNGAGLAVAPGALSDAAAWMQSWHRSGSELSLTRHSLNPTAVNYYDYTEMEWFREPVARGEPHLAGPYMDFGGTDRRIVTAALPVSAWNDSVSVLVADLSLPSLERILLAALGASCGGAALVTSGGKVIATNSALVAVTGRSEPGLTSAVAEVPTTEVAIGWRLIALD